MNLEPTASNPLLVAFCRLRALLEADGVDDADKPLQPVDLRYDTREQNYDGRPYTDDRWSVALTAHRRIYGATPNAALDAALRELRSQASAKASDLEVRARALRAALDQP